MKSRYKVLLPGWIFLALLIGYGQFASPAEGQEAPKQTPPTKSKTAKEKSQRTSPNEDADQSKPNEGPEVIRLKFAEADETVRVLKVALGFKTPEGEDTGEMNFPIAVDERTNSIIVNARTPGELFKIRNLITKLDVAPESKEADARNLSVIPLGSVQPDHSLENALQMVLAGKVPKANFTIDRQRKALIIWADDKTKQMAVELLARLEQTGRDERKTSEAAADLRVRVIWIVDGRGQQRDGPPLPDDLKEVAPGLAKLGLDHPRVAAQTLVHAIPGTEFQARGVARLDAPCQFTISGRVLSGAEPPKLSIDIRANHQRPNGPQDLCSLRTEITAPLGHLVVLGLTPTDETTSAFVVQVLGK
jgi:hypothetical protein